MSNKNEDLEEKLSYLNDILYEVELNELQKVEEPLYPTLFIIGCPRTGSTLLTQWLASLDIFAYPSNFLSRLYKAPYIGSLIYEIVSNPKYQYGKEFSDILDVNTEHKFISQHGKTQGFKSPHEFWYFWKRFYDFPIHVKEEEDFDKNFDSIKFEKELALIQKAFDKPLFMKGKIINYYLESFSKNINKAIYLHLRRSPVATIRSLLRARRNKGSWFSWKLREYNLLKEMDIYHQAAGQIYFIEREILSKKNHLGSKYLSFSYEDFCKDPKHVYERITGKVLQHSPQVEFPRYNGESTFNLSNPVSNEDDKIKKAYQYFEDRFGTINS